ncbi:methyltransferase domain-containing protein 6 [Elsinoe australis]|uniref:Methyltransferase domain-containing protein 6 n=1 Tax=Elsinoe australis TaxID=40998 RepID=A0A4U7B9C9_9PEZI|nr:methyltransferase domain-containing protein 6 [Elsinoe australis]
MTDNEIDGSTVLHFGRKYHQYSIRHGANLLPVDQTEADRLLSLVRLQDTLDGLILVPGFEPRDILDCGYGSEAWADEVMQSNDDVEPYKIVGIDVYTENFDDDYDEAMADIDEAMEIDAYQGEEGNRALGMDDEGEEADLESHETVFYQKSTFDLNQSLQYNQDLFVRRGMGYHTQQRFDLVNIRCLTEGIVENRWPGLLNELRTLLRPGGWIQMTELDFGNIQSSSGRLHSDRVDNANGLERWIECYREGMRLTRRNRRIGELAPRLLGEQGYINIRILSRPLCIGQWSAEDQSGLGNQIKEAIEQSLYAVGLWFACVVQGIDVQDFQNMIQDAVRDLNQPGVNPYIWCHQIIAQRPVGTSGHKSRSSSSSIDIKYAGPGSPSAFKKPQLPSYSPATPSSRRS